MDTVVLVLGWVLFGWLLIWGIASFLSKHPDGAVRAMTRIQGLVLLASCAVVLVFPISKLWLIAAIPVGVVFPMMLMAGYMESLKQRFPELERESAETGIPLSELLDREAGKSRRR